MPPESRQRTVFVGNIAFDATEDELKTLFSSVGPVVTMRIVHDRDTGKRKGFGFAEYSDAETALSAVRNLNDIDFHGRQLRVNIADQESKNSNESAMSRKRKAQGGSSAASGVPHADSAPMVHLPPVSDPIAHHIEGLGRSELFELVTQAKGLFATQPEEAKRLVTSQPQIFRALELALDRLAGPHWPPPDAGATSAVPTSSAPSLVPEVLVKIEEPLPAAAAADPRAALAPVHVTIKQETATPLVPTGMDPGSLDPVLAESLLQLTPEQLAQMPPAQRQQLVVLRQAVMAGRAAS